MKVYFWRIDISTHFSQFNSWTESQFGKLIGNSHVYKLMGADMCVFFFGLIYLLIFFIISSRNRYEMWLLRSYVDDLYSSQTRAALGCLSFDIITQHLLFIR